MSSEQRSSNHETFREYEELVFNLIAQSFDGMTGVELVDIDHDLKITGVSGYKHQIDVCYRFRIWEIEVLVIVECKQYSQRVGIGELLEFQSRISDIRAHKGVFVTTVGFQKGAHQFAKESRIALIVAKGTMMERVEYLLDNKHLMPDREIAIIKSALHLDSYRREGFLGKKYAGATCELIAMQENAEVQFRNLEIGFRTLYRKSCKFRENERETYFELNGTPVHPSKLLKLHAIEHVVTKKPIAEGTGRLLADQVADSVRQVFSGDIRCFHLGNGHIHMIASFNDVSEKRLVLAAARKVIGVARLSYEGDSSRLRLQVE